MGPVDGRLTREPDELKTLASDRPYRRETPSGRERRKRLDKYGRPDTIVVDLDGTLLEDRYPELGEWLPGAQEALRAFLKAGFRVEIHSCRFHSRDAHTFTLREPRAVFEAIQRVRWKLDRAGFHEVDICTSDKPPARYYIDDRGIEFKGNWRKIVRRICG